ncbi:MAG: hypothetical protein WAZ28_00015, partial [Microbacterium sp.]
MAEPAGADSVPADLLKAFTAAQVTPRAQALDRSVWRTVGDPLWQGAWEGPLAGLTVAVKDLFAVKGYR